MISENIFANYNLSVGNHSDKSKQFCAIEAYNHALGNCSPKIKSDFAPDVDLIIQEMIRTWNDRLPSNNDRNRLLIPLLPLLRNTRTTKKSIVKQRQLMILDWKLRVKIPLFLEAFSLNKEAQMLRSLPQVTLLNLKKVCNITAVIVKSVKSSASDILDLKKKSRNKKTHINGIWNETGPMVILTSTGEINEYYEVSIRKLFTDSEQGAIESILTYISDIYVAIREVRFHLNIDLTSVVAPSQKSYSNLIKEMCALKYSKGK